MTTEAQQPSPVEEFKVGLKEILTRAIEKGVGPDTVIAILEVYKHTIVAAKIGHGRKEQTP